MSKARPFLVMHRGLEFIAPEELFNAMVETTERKGIPLHEGVYEALGAYVKKNAVKRSRRKPAGIRILLPQPPVIFRCAEKLAATYIGKAVIFGLAVDIALTADIFRCHLLGDFFHDGFEPVLDNVLGIIGAFGTAARRSAARYSLNRLSINGTNSFSTCRLTAMCFCSCPMVSVKRAAALRNFAGDVDGYIREADFDINMLHIGASKAVRRFLDHDGNAEFQHRAHNASGPASPRDIAEWCVRYRWRGIGSRRCFACNRIADRRIAS